MSPPYLIISLDLKEFREGASTTSLGNKFHAFTTLFENTFPQTFNLDDVLKSFRPLLRVDDSSLILNNLFIVIRSIWYTILYTLITSALSLLYSKYGIRIIHCMVDFF